MENLTPTLEASARPKWHTCIILVTPLAMRLPAVG